MGSITVSLTGPDDASTPPSPGPTPLLTSEALEPYQDFGICTACYDDHHQDAGAGAGAKKVVLPISSQRCPALCLALLAYACAVSSREHACCVGRVSHSYMKTQHCIHAKEGCS